MQNKNFVAPLALRNEQFNNSPAPEILPANGLVGLFGSESTNVKFSGVDPVRESQAFLVKYALLFVLNALVVTSFCWYFGASSPIWFVIFAITNFFWFWFLGTNTRGVCGVA